MTGAKPPVARSLAGGPNWVLRGVGGFEAQSGAALSAAEEAAGLRQCFLDTQTYTGKLPGAGPWQGGEIEGCGCDLG